MPVSPPVESQQVLTLAMCLHFLGQTRPGPQSRCPSVCAVGMTNPRGWATGQVVVSATKGTDNKGSFQMRSGLGFYSPCGGSPWRAGEDGSGGRGCMGASFRLPLRTMQFHSDHQVAGLSVVSGLGLAGESPSLYTGYRHRGRLEPGHLQVLQLPRPHPS